MKAAVFNRYGGNEVVEIIDGIYPLDQAKEALAYSETGRAKGKIVLKMSDRRVP